LPRWDITLPGQAAHGPPEELAPEPRKIRVRHPLVAPAQRRPPAARV